MSTCIRNGVAYKRHHWEKQVALADVTTCNNCGQIKGGVFEQRSEESSDSGTGSELQYRDLPKVSGSDGGMSMPAGDSGDVDECERVEAT